MPDNTFSDAQLAAATFVYVQVSVDSVPGFITLAQLKTLLAAQP
jgi:hypothetical protein